MLTMDDSLKRQSGASLIEVLIALGLVAVTMLGLLGLQLRTLGLQKDSLDRRAAAVIVGGFADRVAINFTAFTDGNYNNLAMGPAAAPPAIGTIACTTVSPSTCTPAQVARASGSCFGWRSEIGFLMASRMSRPPARTHSSRSAGATSGGRTLPQVAPTSSTRPVLL